MSRIHWQHQAVRQIVKRRQQLSGHTLIELLLAITLVIGILVFTTVQLHPVAAQLKLRNQLLSINLGLETGRQLASSQQVNVVACPLTSNQCSNDWSSSKIQLFVDRDGSNTAPTHQDIINVIEIDASAWQLNGPQSGLITFFAGGSLASPATLRLCHKELPALNGKISISLQARLTSTTFNADC